MAENYPTVLVISGHDPTGGAGIQADIETLSALQCIPVSIITLTSQQDTQQLYHYEPQNPVRFRQQLQCLLDDIAVDAIKIGAIGSIEIAKILVEVLSNFTDIPIVIDPVLAAGGGGELSNADFEHYLSQYLLPLATLITPNSIELLKLAKHNEETAAIHKLLSLGLKNILVTGGHKDGLVLEHVLYCYSEKQPSSYKSKRLAGEFHGSGCTLASAITAYLAHNNDLHNSILKGLEFTQGALQDARRLGTGQMIPNRFYSGKSSSEKMPQRGLYAISDDSLQDYEQIINKTIIYLQAGVSVFQFRWKDKADPNRYYLALTLRALCAHYRTCFIVNDDIELAIAINADGLHIGKDDISLAEARERLPHAILGVSCYQQLDKAIEAEEQGADYIAFGAFFSSRSKPEAPSVSIDILAQARQKLSIPIVAIGGITPDNGKTLLNEGADMLAVISGLYQSPDDHQSVSRYLELFKEYV